MIRKLQVVQERINGHSEVNVNDSVCDVDNSLTESIEFMKGKFLIEELPVAVRNRFVCY